MSPMKVNPFRRHALAVLAAAGLALAGLAGLAAPGNALAATTSPAPHGQATPPRAGSATEEPGVAHVRRACAAPKPGYAACLALARTNVRSHLGMFAAGVTPSGYGPTDLRSAYRLPSATAGSGQTVAVVDAYDDPNAAADLQVYRRQYGLPPCTAASGCFRKVNGKGQAGRYPPADPGWAEEESLDIDMVSAICPNCRIILVEAADSTDANLGQAVNTAVTLGAKYVSNSYGAAEYSGETVDDADYDHPGVAITAATGDSGYNNGSYDAPNWPASSEYVTAVGGTSLTRDPGSPRGWSEAAWNYGGSGCSLFEAKPPWQHDTGCAANHMTADVSAVADPDTGVAVYDSYSSEGWTVVGGTSVASPIIASVYALAGPPTAGSYPASYPYADPSAFNDITNGTNLLPRSCTPAYWCNARPGYDGPTGLGSPEGVAGFFAGRRGTITGTITSTVARRPVAGARIEAGGLTATTDSSGHYTLSVPAGTYTVTATDLDYATGTDRSVRVAANRRVTVSFRLRPVPTVTVSGTVRDRSGHRWPLLAQVSVAGTTAVTYTDPATGHYSLAVPENSTRTVTVDPVYPGYQQAQKKIQTATTGLTRDITVPVDASACTAPGYQHAYTGTTQTFDGTTAPAGWHVTTRPAAKTGWLFGTPDGGGDPGTTGNYAWAGGGPPDSYPPLSTSLYTPVTDMTSDASPVVQFNAYYLHNNGDGTGGIYVDLSTDGGAAWHTVWEWGNSSSLYGQQFTVPLPQAAGKSQVQIRFRYVDRSTTGNFGWSLDDVFFGNQSCSPSISGGLLVGTVTDGNTGHGIAGADVTSTGSAQETTTTGQVPGPAASGGFYWMFSPLTGSQQFQATGYDYDPQTTATSVAADAATELDFTLHAGRLAATPDAVSATTQLGSSARRSLTLTNTGTKPVSLQLGQQPGGFTLSGQPAVPAAAGWGSLPALPAAVFKPLVVTDPATGDVYALGGGSRSAGTTPLYVYQPGATSWTTLPALPSWIQYPEGAFVNGRIYVLAGVEILQPSHENPVWIYDPATQQWSTGAFPPNGGSEMGSAVVLNGNIYVIGGVHGEGIPGVGNTQVYVYHPGTNTWTSAASYPRAIAFEACGAFNGHIYCAGGTSDVFAQNSLSSAYAYDPSTSKWSVISPLPTPLFDSAAYTAANGHLLIAGGVKPGDTITSLAYSYTPGAGWARLPSLPQPIYEGSGTCGPGGFYVVGGTNATSDLADAEVLPGYSDCGAGTKVPWLSVSPSTATLQPGQSVTATVTLKAGNASVTQPGSYTAQINVESNTPGQLTVPVTMTVTPPKTWGKITGVVTGASTGSPVAGATVQVCTLYDPSTGSCGTGSKTYTLTTAADGSYGLWLDQAASPVRVTVSDAGYTPASKTATITKGKTTIANFALSKS